MGREVRSPCKVMGKTKVVCREVFFQKADQIFVQDSRMKEEL